MRYQSFAALILVIASGVAQANLVTNGDFETGDFTSWTHSGNTFVGSDVLFRTQASAAGSFPRGVYVVDFGGGDTPATGVLMQDIATNPGQEYKLTLDYGKFGAGADPQSLLVEAIDPSNNQRLLNTVISDPLGEGNLALVFGNYSYLFVASNSSVRLSFSDVSLGTVNADGFLDNVSVAAVPLPASVWLFLSGLSSLIVGFRRHMA